MKLISPTIFIFIFGFGLKKLIITCFS